MTADPVALALLRRLSELRPPGDPLHAFAATVLSGEATLRAAAGHLAFCGALERLEAARRAEAGPVAPPGGQHVPLGRPGVESSGTSRSSRL
ncbi:hypothetical protein OHA72_55835 [Dactylosporangium sp. NBC_01737]|uniref:hypothetical protein n=1 Tax=Dactylosporangium sp. NBC_01737 TaxID=2975959 RepID=UPI002E14A658|nr:hypothetical protein OHA72_55835 [Dactylosporangium sp. NBC_01737]